MSKIIKLYRGEEAIVDDNDYDFLSQYRWHLSGRYVVRNQRFGRKTIKFYMHREVMKPKNGQEVDHINRNALDNRKENLRICTRLDNSRNQNKRKGSSKYKGVIWRKDRKTWQAKIRVNYKRIYLGNFSNEKLAAIAYDKAALKYHGKYANINFDIKNYLNNTSIK